MKKLIVTAMTTLSCAAAFAQGKVSLVNDSLHLVYWDPVFLKPADMGLAGTGPTNGPTPSGAILVVDLYQGTSSYNLTYLSSTTMSPIPGRFGPTTVVIGLTAPSSQFYQVQVRDSTSSESYIGYSQIFTCGSGNITPVSIVSGSSTWAPGTYDASAIGGPGALGVIDLAWIPEPNTLALAALGAAAIWAFRRSK